MFLYVCFPFSHFWWYGSGCWTLLRSIGTLWINIAVSVCFQIRNSTTGSNRYKFWHFSICSSIKEKNCRYLTLLSGWLLCVLIDLFFFNMLFRFDIIWPVIFFMSFLSTPCVFPTMIFHSSTELFITLFNLLYEKYNICINPCCWTSTWFISSYSECLLSSYTTVNGRLNSSIMLSLICKYIQSFTERNKK